MRAALGIAFACTLLLPGQAALAQDPPAAVDQTEIVITGERNVEQHVRDYVGALAPGRPRDQVGRFETAVCPAALGLSVGNRAAVEARLRAVAEAAGMTVAPADCSVNALLMVVDDKRAFIQALRREHGRYLGNLTTVQIRRLLRTPGPTAAWQMTGRVSARGVPVNSGGSSAPLDWFNRTTEPPSRITAPTRPVIEGSILLVERRALAGLTATQLADYAAMRLFASTDPEGLEGSTAPTIVTILDAPMGSEVPLTLTEWDLGFLRGLYSSPNNFYAGAQRSEMVREIMEQFDETERERD